MSETGKEIPPVGVIVAAWSLLPLFLFGLFHAVPGVILTVSALFPQPNALVWLLRSLGVMMSSWTFLRALILKDTADNAALIASALRRADFALDWRWVHTETDYLAALDFYPEIILADGSLSPLTAARALQLLCERNLPIPFFVVGGNDSRATDSLLQDQLVRLAPAIRRTLDEKRMREEKRQVDEALQLSEADFRGAFDCSATGMALLSQEGRWLYVNKALCETIGYSASELSTLPMQAVLHPEDAPMTLAAIDTLVSGQLASCLIDTRYLHKNGSELWASTNLSVVCDTQGQPRSLMAHVQHRSAPPHADKALQQTVETRTGLLNRRRFLDRLQHALQRMKRGGTRDVAVLSLALDHFQLLKHSLGHMSGDQLLIALAGRLAGVVGSVGAVAQVGEDEFAILLEDYPAVDDVIRLAERLGQEVVSPLSVNGREVCPTASIGIAFHTNEHQQPEEVLRDAAIAMHYAKAQGQARIEVFTPAMRTRTVNRLHLEADLRWALKRREFCLHYQPLFTLASGQLHGCEALLRWQHPSRGLLSPGEFLSVAEETGLILPIGWWVLEEACRQIQDWRERFVLPAAFTVSINLASSQFAHPELLPRLDHILQESSFPDLAVNLQFEITEHALMDCLTVIAGQLACLQNRGITIALDDFGTGYSSLSYLYRLPIDTLKIDRSFVSRLGDDDKSAAVVSAMVKLAHTLGMNVIAEGVETAEQRDHLRELRCAYGQGYYFSRPLPADAVEQLLTAKSSWALRVAA